MKNALLREKRRYGLPEEITEYEQELLEQGVPVQKIIGYIIFDDIKVNVKHDVLIPRYETEEVMRKALEYINENSRVLDLCTGSGYIGLSIKEKAGASVVMSDISKSAIAQSYENAEENDLDVEIIQSDMFENISGKFDVIVSNPPYIPEDVLLSSGVIEHEPHNALFGGKDGNDFYKIIVEQGPKFLNDSGVIVLEISEDNTEFLRQNGFEIFNDINEKERIAVKRY